MAMFGRQNTVEAEPETIIGPSVRVEGNFSGSGDVVVEGSLSGTLKTSKSVRIGAGAKVKADVEAGAVFIAGEVRGNVKSTGTVELTATAKLIGNVEATKLSVESGAVLNGRCTMTVPGTEAVGATPERKVRREPSVA